MQQWMLTENSETMKAILGFWIRTSVRATIDRYMKHHSDSTNTGSVSEANTQFYQQESAKLRRQIRDIQTANKQILGESLGVLNHKELKNLEGKVEKAIGRVRSKKNELLFSEIELMQKRVSTHRLSYFLQIKDENFHIYIYIYIIYVCMPAFTLALAISFFKLYWCNFFQEIELQNANMYLRAKVLFS
nr:floral homeotic protein AGAMOUS-like isoform X1 [Ipomoea batatas]